MAYKPPTPEAKRFYEKMKNQHLPSCDKCACKHCVNWDKCRDCPTCESGTYTLPCKYFEEK